MASVSMKTTLNASADKAWDAIRDFGGIGKFVASIATCEVTGSGVGATRRIEFEGGGAIVERLESLDDASRTLTYSIIEGELPFENYLSTMSVRDLGQGRCEVSWASTFDPTTASEAECKGIAEGVYSEGFEGLKKLLAG